MSIATRIKEKTSVCPKCVDWLCILQNWQVFKKMLDVKCYWRRYKIGVKSCCCEFDQQGSLFSVFPSETQWLHWMCGAAASSKKSSAGHLLFFSPEVFFCFFFHHHSLRKKPNERPAYTELMVSITLFTLCFTFHVAWFVGNHKKKMLSLRCSNIPFSPCMIPKRRTWPVSSRSSWMIDELPSGSALEPPE